MSLLVVGTVAIDTVETPFGVAEAILGGSAVYFSLAAAHFTPVSLVSVVGEDFPERYHEFLRSRKVGLDGLVVAPGKTFRWDGIYKEQMNEAQTRRTELNVFEDFDPIIPESCRSSRFVFLANCPPRTQLKVRRQVPGATFVLADTMNFWIQNERRELLELMENVDGLIVNDAEARQLSGKHNVLTAARWICEHGPSYCIVKKAEHGAVLMGPQGQFVLPAYPTESVKDPTGAGDSFAGGLMGYTASRKAVDAQILRRALAYGAVVASFTIEDFGPARLCEISRQDIEDRLKEFVRHTRLD